MYSIYLPAARGYDDARLDAVGLAALHGANSPPVNWLDVQPAHAPDERGGVMAWWGGIDVTPPLPNDYTTWDWRPAAPDAERGLPAARFWMGKPPGAVISPEMLARPRLYESEPVLLDDGQSWMMPIARELPRRWSIDPATGEDRWSIDEQYAQFVADANHTFHATLEIFDQVAAGKSPAEVHSQLDTKVLVRLACDGLALNYLLTRDLIDWLGLVRKFETWFWLCGAPWELKTRAAIAAEKKTAGCTRGS